MGHYASEMSPASTDARDYVQPQKSLGMAKSDYPTIDSVLEDTEKLLAMTTEMLGLLGTTLSPVLKPDMRAEAGGQDSMPRESEPISGLNMRLQRFNRDLGVLHREIAELRTRVDLS